MKQKPACILDIRVPAGTFDVNLTPDKREIVLAHGQFRFNSRLFYRLQHYFNHS